MTAITLSEVRTHLIEALQLDLVGPTPDNIDYAEEIIDQAPSKWYLTGFLVPYGASTEQRADDTGNDELDEVGRVGSGDDEDTPEKTFAQKAFFPSSMGLSLLVNENTSNLNATIAWGDYAPYKDNSDGIEAPAQEQPTMSGCWKRIPHEVELIIPLQSDNNTELKHSHNLTIAIPDSNGLQ